MNENVQYIRCAGVMPLSLLAVAVMVGSGNAQAALDSFTNPRVNWNNNFTYNLMYRVDNQDPKLLLNPGNRNSANLDDGNANFDRGIVSNRLELLSELDLVFDNGWGARVSGLGWYDDVYNQGNDNPGFAGGAAPNQNGRADEFHSTTREYQGRDAELRDAFVFGRINLGDTRLRLRAGQYASVWGESLFFANNAIAGAQNGFDIDRLLRDPTAEAKEFVLPVPQIGAEWQLSHNLTLASYYQVSFQPNRLPAIGSYFSSNDMGVVGAERMYIGPGMAAPYETTHKPDGDDQFGLQLRWRYKGTDLGFYALRFHDKSYQQVVRLGLIPGVGPAPQSYYLTYHEGTTAYGFSASRSFGDVNLAMETSIRKDQALASSNAADTSLLGGPPTDNKNNPGYAVGDTAHINVSTIWMLKPGLLWQEATFVGEVAWNRLLSCNTGCDGPNAALASTATRDAFAMRGVFEPTYRQILPGLDLGVPIGIGYSPKGSRSSVGPGYPAEDGGDLTIGLSGVYFNAWHLNLAYTKFYGKTEGFLQDDGAFSYQQSLKDRDFVSFTVRHTF